LQPASISRLMKSLVALHHVELGFQPGNVLVMKATGVRRLQEKA
jgi:hypothetical protein